MGWKGKTEVVRGANFTCLFDVDEIWQVGRFGFTEEIVSNDFEMPALFDLPQDNEAI